MSELLGYQFNRTYGQPIEKYRQVSTIAERDAIPNTIRWEGMLCYVTSEETDYQLKGGLTNLDWQVSSVGNFFDTTVNDSDDITEGITNLFLSPTDQTKINNITITQAVDLDALEIAVNSLSGGLTFKGLWDASSGSFPSGANTGFLYIVSVAGTVDSVYFDVGDSLAAITDSASTTVFASNWVKFESVSDVTSVAGLTGVITKAGLLSALNVEDGATADMTGAEIVSAITSELTTADWQTQLTSEQVIDYVAGVITSSSHSNISILYDDANNKLSFQVTDFIQVYSTLAIMISAQAFQSTRVIYEVTDASGFTGIVSGTAWVRYLGTTNGDESDYIVISSTSNDLTNYVDKTSSQTITGTKTFSTGIQIDQFTPLDVGLEMLNGTSSPSIKVTSVSSGDAFVSNQTSTGRAFVGKNTETETFTVNKEGDVIGNSFGTSDGIIKKTVKVSLTADQIKNGSTTPIEIVPAQGVGKTIIVTSGVVKLNFGTTAFTSTRGEFYNVVSAKIAETNGMINNLSDIISSINLFGNDLSVNTPLMFKINADSAVGDGTLDIYLEYSIYTID